MNYTVSLRQRSGTWSYQIFVEGKYHSSKSGFTTKMDAKKAGNIVGSKIRTPARSKDTFKSIFDLFLLDGSKEPATKASYKSWVKVYKPIYDKELAKLTYTDVAPLVHDYYLTHKYNGAQCILRLGKAIVNFAIDKLDYDMRNPFDKIKLAKKTDKAKKEHRILTMSEMKDLFSKIEDPDIRFLTMCFGLAGLRISEARGLTYNSFNLKKDKLTINSQIQHVGGEKITKDSMKSSNSNRVIPLHPLLKAEFKSRPMNIDKNAPIITTDIRSFHTSKAYRELGYTNLTAHSFRHAYATAAIHNGMNFKTLSEMLGDTLQTVMNTYSHVSSDMYSEAESILTNL